GKTNARSTVHRLAHMDYIGVKKLDGAGRQVGEERFLGLFTSKAYGDHADRIPILRRKLRWILEDAGAEKGAHDYKEINTIFNSMPKEELFLSSAREIAKDVRTALTSYHTTGVQVTRREDRLRRGASFMVIIPREKFSAKARKAIENAFVNLLGGEVLNYHLAMGGGEQARLHFYLRVRPELLDVVTDVELKRLVQELTRDWTDRVGDELGQVRPRGEARRLAHRYAAGFGADYRAVADPDAAARDILQLEAMVADGRSLSIALSNPGESALAPGDRATELRLYRLGPRLVLSHFMPILENAGLRVIAERPAQLRGSGVPEGAVHTFAVQTSGKSPLDLGEVGSVLVDTILAVSAGDVTNDRLNALVPTARLAWREVEVLRAYASYAFQLGAVPSRDSIVDALLNYPRIARLLFGFFETRFDPREPALDRREADMDATRAKLLAALDDVYLLSDDRALRHLLTLIEATVRTNYYATGGSTPTRRSGGVPYMSFKVMARALTSLTRTSLLCEAWVRSARMEGVHLRGARVARGGIRYSDRPDDFRTEVLGLAETQIVKNSVIVPAGSKGGFVILDQPSLSVATRSEVERQYRTLMRGLLDLTDNLHGGTPVPPDGVVCYDDPDPYLVVAADKGTAGFSDIANAVADDYGFWLDDAFASGGSNGYDHKELSITARGAWECVKRHFREMGKDIQSEPFSVVGIGDMSGDVFGNGMLLSPHIRLIAAFDHRHIFIDPDPDPHASFEERERLFHRAGSSWADYDASAMSPGGIIVRRGSKEVELSPEARAALGISRDPGRVSGEELVRLVLQADAELLWNGGIGTYVKASDETHADVADPSNIPVRVDAGELRVKVVGEGGNLGLTQRARTEFALAGGRLNVDALDYSGGDSLSDREVNLKILLNAVVEDGRMTGAERNRMLRDLADPVCDQVLRDNASQSLAVSLDVMRAREGVDDFRQLISELERDGFFDRSREHLPTWEQLLERDETGSRLTRPELCVLLAHAKLHLMRRLLKGTLIDDPVASGYLARYFPPVAVDTAGEPGLAAHRLGREIVASQLTNDLVDLMGAGFVHRMMRDSGASADEVARAWLVASRLSGHRQLIADLCEREREAGTAVAYRWYRELGRVLDRTTRWVLGNAEREEIDSLVGGNFSTLRELQRIFPDVVSGEDRLTFERLVSEIQEVGPAADIAPALATLRFLDQLMDILRVARDTRTAPVYAARAYYAVSELLEIPWLRHAIDECARDERWEQRAARALNDDLTRAHHRIANFSAAAAAARATQAGGVAHVLTALRSREVAYFGELLTELRAE
ncbi:MAG: NAD-glutamate dehydrogenase, partial [Gammaproteobacteria bacterium]|nr:NAD-glutamate dehydrogenase [Gammaproteobacteria bacterium]